MNFESGLERNQQKFYRYVNNNMIPQPGKKNKKLKTLSCSAVAAMINILVCRHVDINATIEVDGKRLIKSVGYLVKVIWYSKRNLHPKKKSHLECRSRKIIVIPKIFVVLNDAAH